MATYSNGTKTASYKYDENGIRTSKTVNGTKTSFFVDGTTILAQKVGNIKIPFYYDGNGKRIAFKYGGSMYFYVYNLQGDVTHILDDDANIVGTYTYDAWGKITNLSSLTSIAQTNPFRYRGYYYDTESGLYYLNSRYYNPDWGRFISADGYVSTGQGLTGYNLFAYCGNNPVNRKDPSGHALETVFDIISLVANVAEVIANPIDPWAWAGLLGDIVDVAVPFVGGLGETVDVAKTAIQVVDKGDDIIDAAKKMRHTADAVDNIKDSTGAYVVLFEQGQHYIGKGGFNRAITSATEHLTETNKVSAIIWAPTPSKESAFVTEYLLQSTFGLNKTYEKSYNLIWSPGKKIFSALQ